MSTHTFQTEVKRLLDIVVHSLYSEREIFLRELVANASDACDKLRFQALTKPELLKGDDQLAISINWDKDARTLTITDNGIGLTEAEAIDHLGTIAKSGTREFLQAAGEQQSNLSGLIGQFGVGFYSAFMVAETVVVESRSASVSSDEGVRWESQGDGNFSTERITRPQRGTTITLHLREDAVEYADRWRIRSLIKKHSDYVAYPVRIPKTDKPEEHEQINAAQAIWTRQKSDITDEQYTEFYRAACHAWDQPASRLHFQVEGSQSFTGLLFFPGEKPMDLFDRERKGLSLYVRRVFITDTCTELLPEWLRFVKGIVDSDDLPLNVSREMLQQNQTVQRLRKQLTKRVIDHLEKLAKSEEQADREAFANICHTHGAILREGIVNDFEHKDRLLGLARWQSSATVGQEAVANKPALTGLAAYVSRMREGQKAIYVATGSTLAAAQNTPQVEGFLAKGYEVLYAIEAVDEWVLREAKQFEGKDIVHVAQGEAELADDAARKVLSEQAEQAKPFLEWAKEQLGEGIDSVRLTDRLTDSPCCLITPKDGINSHMEQLLKRMGQDAPVQKRILELNPKHGLVQRLQALQQDEAKRSVASEHLLVLRDQALLAEGSAVPDQAAFARRVQKLLATAVG